MRVKPEWVHAYRTPGSTMSGVVGVVAALSPSGTVIRVQMDELGDSYVCVWAAHVEPRPSDNGVAARG